MLQACCFGEGKTPHWGGGMTMSEYRVHYTVWAILASPLILGADIRSAALPPSAIRPLDELSSV